ncbi:MAG: GGDEF domain-containing phosphodiesterase, partial [Chloroflexota bacterium]|nr:GGDEF domain-containing phosphodiesterase [Chloroflexota bacterium]
PGREVMVTVSIGIAVAGDGGSGDLLRRADIAMYEAKRDGKARWALFGGDAETRAAERLLLEGELRRALAEGQLRVVYQPIIDLATDRISEVEALVRWEHPRRGLLPAGEFVPLAEETGLIVPLGKWVLAEACGQARAWQAGRPLSERIAVAVNFSARHFREPGLVDSVASLLSQIGLDPGCLKVEITERVALDDAEETAAALRGLKALGVGLVVDDFGTGYSGLSSLKRTAIDTVKIDQVFVAGLGHGGDDEAIVHAVVALARALGLATTAEGVETAAQLDLVRALGCDHAQGYYVAGPLTAAEVEPLLVAAPRSSEGDSHDHRASTFPAHPQAADTGLRRRS